MKKVLKWVLIVLVVLIIIGIFAGKDKDGSDKKPEAVKSSEQKIAMTDKEYKMAELIINNDVMNSLNGNDSQITTDYIRVTAREMQQTYASNEARGDKTYKGKNIIITGIIKSIDSSIGDIPVVSLNTGEMFSTVRLHLAKPYRDMAADLDKNQKITLACVGDSVIIGSPGLKDCKPVPAVASKITNEQMKFVNKFIKGNNEVPNEIKQIVLLAKVLGKETGDFSQCQDINSKCMNDSVKVLKSISKEKLQEEAKLLGVEM
ncbi:hypothetical protein ACFYLL_14010 [Proteus mirabilis]|uniref:OB-fold protein n=1 Tax=Proteus mirabilis TaxID=584 RepID=UPI0006694CD3|nr:hypothetical protein [Proteus mirabilis]MBI6336398.1 hypothetical protein [Proteus mirabilis]MDM3726835.1 hypothetical protein [Proteus mirabilis]UTA57032.1 hypothetical protein J3U92_13575 [Proteus mirabilis]UTA60352.1 hypothetical protein J3U93_13595 [Proteus mirabilis]UTA63675.1 hypothetical protein J3U94_13605 [Proteus mirabilis]